LAELGRGRGFFLLRPPGWVVLGGLGNL